METSKVAEKKLRKLLYIVENISNEETDIEHPPTPAANKDLDTEPNHNILVSSDKNTKTQPSKGYITMLDIDDPIGADNHTKVGENNRCFCKQAVSKVILHESFSVRPVRNENILDSQHVQFEGDGRATSSKAFSHKPTQNLSTAPTNFSSRSTTNRIWSEIRP